MIQHVIPIQDIKPHSEHVVYSYQQYMGDRTPDYCSCSCNPTMIPDDAGGYIFVHSTFDGREAIEEVNEILK